MPTKRNKVISVATFLKKDFLRFKYIYLMAIPVLAYYIIFCYIPMYGAQIAFKNYSAGKGIWGSPWVGFVHFETFFNGVYFKRLVQNTVTISGLGMLFGFPAPIILALLLNELRSSKFKKVVQTVTYLPHFISIMVIGGLITAFSAKSGLLNDIIAFFGGTRVNLLQYPQYFRTLYISTDIWQGIGWGTIVYLAALSGIDIQLYEAAAIDGAGRWRKLIHVTLPGLQSTMVILLILRLGQIMNVGHEKILLLYNENTYSVADVISTYVYRIGLLRSSYSFSSAVGLFNTAINLVMVFSANMISRKVSETSLW